MRLIDADALIECLQTWKTVAVSEGLPINERFAMAMIAQVNLMPTIEPERKKGNWIDEGVYADGHGAHAFRCSECGGHIIEYDADPFCKWCGADMRGESDDIPIEYFESGGI